MGYDLHYDKQFKYWIFSMWTNWSAFRFGFEWFWCRLNGQRGFQEFTIYFGPFGFEWTKYKTTKRQRNRWLKAVRNGSTDKR